MVSFAAKIRDMADFLIQGSDLYIALREVIVEAVKKEPSLENYTFSLETLRNHFGVEDGNDLIDIAPIVIGYFRNDGFSTSENESGVVISW